LLADGVRVLGLIGKLNPPLIGEAISAPAAGPGYFRIPGYLSG
jgi:hypothetical protein